MYNTIENRMTLGIRIAGASDAPDLRRLAQLDTARPLRGTALLAIVDGRPVAAVSLADGRVVADPFIRTAAVVQMLQVRRAQLAQHGAGTSSLPRRPRTLALRRRLGTHAL
jgi:hypothetical protein